ncbi:MAG: DUF3316 domain-containing protein [Muribaculaceae bacterium]|nr:DUF3316 domain-containing protein [Muribaculaceae bacterium]
MFLSCTFIISKGEELTGNEKMDGIDNSMSRPVTGVYSFEIGGTSVLATYLSPLKYTGKRYSLSGNWSKALPFNPEHAIMEFNGAGEFSSLLNPAQTARMLGLQASFSWGMAWRKKLCHGFQITAGAAAGIAGGAYYLVRNGNNPVQAMAAVSLDLTASVSKPFKLGKLPILFSDKLQIPSLSVFFNPGYGETYYEIYLGNMKGLAHAGWWGNNFRLDNLLSFTLDFGRTSMLLGYRFTACTQWANCLNTKIFSNSFVIGVVPGGIGLKKQPRRLPEETVYAIY